jgi:class 3 adenylate cyclase
VPCWTQWALRARSCSGRTKGVVWPCCTRRPIPSGRARFRGQEHDTAGDGFFATFDGPARAIRAGQAIVAGIRDLDLDLRVGIHVGECELQDDKPTGLAVNIGARVAAQAQPGEILVTRTVRDLVAGSGFGFHDRGERELKGIPGTWRLYAAGQETPP